MIPLIVTTGSSGRHNGYFGRVAALKGGMTFEQKRCRNGRRAELGRFFYGDGIPGLRSTRVTVDSLTLAAFSSGEYLPPLARLEQTGACDFDAVGADCSLLQPRSGGRY